MVRIPAALLAGVLLAATVLNANAAIIFQAVLSGSQEAPPNASTASGEATFVLNDTQTALTMTATIRGIDVTGTQTADTADNIVNAHIHGSPTAVPGVNAGVVWGFFGAPDSDTNAVATFVPLPGGAVGGTIVATWDATEGNAGATLTTQLANLLAGTTYVNFHTVAFPGGEIRGQILRVPEPASLALLGVAAFGLVGFRGRRGAASAA